MYKISLLSVSVDQYQSWRDHQRILYIHYTEKVSGQCELQIVWPHSDQVCHVVGGIQNVLSWSLDIWLSH